MKKFIGLLGVLLLSLLIAPSVSATAISPGSIIKGSNQSVYYLGADSKRYVFPTQKTFLTWFADFNHVLIISDDLLSSLQVGGNVTYRPDSRLIKVNSDPRVYYVDKNGTLRWIQTEGIAIILFGTDWNKLVDDLPVSYFMSYQIGEDIASASDVTTVEDSYSINQDKGIGDAPDPTYSADQSITLSGSASGSTVSLKWTLNNLTSPKGFKVVNADHSNPVYPGDDYHYLSEPDTRSDVWYGLSAGTYHFRVCEYLGGSCGVYSNDITVIVNESTSNYEYGSITLSKTTSGTTVNLTWKLSGMTSSQGFKVVKAEHSNPVYPGDDYHYLSDASATTDSWTDLSAGTYHFRVCEYLGGKCGVYSNDVTVTITSTTCNSCSGGSITLTKTVSGNSVSLNWALSNMTSSMGFKVVKAEHSNPIYPGDDYHYLSEADTRTDTWDNLETGTYHFRVCEYLGGKCGVYSNDLTVIIP